MENNKFLGYRTLDSIRHRGDFFLQLLYIVVTAPSRTDVGNEFRMVYIDPSMLLFSVQAMALLNIDLFRLAQRFWIRIRLRNPESGSVVKGPS
jgi:hypothetical protein